MVEAHILLATMHVFGMSTLNDMPSNTELFPEGSDQLDSNQRRIVLLLAIREVVDRFVDVSLLSCELTENSSASTQKGSTSGDDNVMEYAREVLSTGLLYMEFADGIREGDGLRILRCWRAFLPIFKATNRFFGSSYSVGTA